MKSVTFLKFGSMIAFALLVAAPALPQDMVSPVDRLAHEQMLVLDSHLDTPLLFEREGWEFGDYHHPAWDRSRVDIPRMEAGGLDGGFFAIYTDQGPLTPEGYAAARDAALLRAAAILRVVAAHADKLAFARNADDAARIAASGKRIVYQSIENSYPLGTDVSMLASFYKLGVRMAGPIHFKNNQFGDSATDKPKWKGLSPLGRAWVAEMNRLGMIIDASHASDDVLDQMLTLSKTPIILSHSGPKAIYNHPRNLDDERMRKLAAAGGVMQINSVYLIRDDTSPEREALQMRQQQFASLGRDERRALLTEIAALDAKETRQGATFDMFMASVLYAIKIMGIDHVGIGADWDGGGGLIGMEDVTALPSITAALRKAGYGDEDIAKVWSGNLLRVLRNCESYAQTGRHAGT